MSKQFPKELFVKIEKDDDSYYFVPAAKIDELAEMGETVKIGIYRLVETAFIETVVKTSGIVKKV